MRTFWKKLVRRTVLVVLILLMPPVIRAAVDSEVLARDWTTASSNPVGFAPSPDTYEPAVVQAYAASVWGWRGLIADHTWIAAKPTGATHYQRYEVIGWRLGRTGSALAESETLTPDQEWYGAAPKLLQDIRGAEAEAIIAALPAAVASYPYPREYRMWPGPNSNTFIAHVARKVPALQLALPGTAIGKDYTGFDVITPATSGTGYQVSLAGMLGVTLAREEGLELNVLGLVLGVSPKNLAVTLPGFGRVPAGNDWTNGRARSAPLP